MSWSATKYGRDRSKLKRSLGRTLDEGKRYGGSAAIIDRVKAALCAGIDSFGELPPGQALKVVTHGHIEQASGGTFHLEITSGPVPVLVDDEPEEG